MSDILREAARVALGETRRRCTARNAAGAPCKNPPILGGFVCVHHGGKAPATQKAARNRLLEMVEPALAVLQRAVRNAPPCPHCGRSDADRDPVALRAAGMILDRAGFHPSVHVEVEPTPSPFAPEAMTAEQVAEHAVRLANRLMDMQANTIDVTPEAEPEPHG